MTPSGFPLNRRSLIVGGLTLPLTAAGMAATSQVAMADGTDAPSNGDTKIVDRPLEHRSTIASEKKPTVQIDGYATMAAATWAGENPDIVELRGQRPDGTWGDWISVDFLTDEGTKATDAAWLGQVKAVQLRAERAGASATREMTLHLIATSAARSDVGKVASAGGTALTLSPGASVQYGTFGPTIFSRADWGANESWSRSTSRSNEMRSVIVHHTAGTNYYAKSESPQVMRGIYSYHTRTLGWADVGYNVIVDKYGQIFEGRQGGLHVHKTGAHAYGFNTGSFGISVMGDYTNISVPDAALRSIATLAAWKLNGVFVEGVHETALYPNVSAAGNIRRSGNVVLPRLIGHRDVNYTSCPGDRFYNSQFDYLRTLTATFMSQANKEHLNAYKAAGGKARLGTVTHIESTRGAYRVTRLTQGIVLTAGGRTTAHQTSFAYEWQPEWGRPLAHTTGTTQAFERGTAVRANGSVTFTPKSAYRFFVDVPNTHLFATEINELAERKVVRGWPDGTFRPDNYVARDAIIAFMYRAMGSPAFTPPARSPFVDVRPTDMFYKEITWAYARRITSGWVRPDGRREFRPLATTNRDAMAAFLARAAGADTSKLAPAKFVDVPPASLFTREIAWLAANGISTGWPDGTFRPLVGTKRHDMAAFLYRWMRLMGRL